MLHIIDGKKISGEIAERLKRQIAELKRPPKLVIIQIGNDEESNVYIKHKKIFAEKIGALVEHKIYPEMVSQENVVTDIEKYNADSLVSGIIVQLPIPPHLFERVVLDSVDPHKDVDGLTSINTKYLFDGQERFVSAATKAVTTILEYENVSVQGKKVVIVGHSPLVGKPTALALMNRGATVTVCHAQTNNLTEETKRADILIVAVGKPGLITKHHVAPGQVIIDVGINVLGTSTSGVKTVVGDVDYKGVKDTVAMITPVPGGVGPVTIACLFESVIISFEACR